MGASLKSYSLVLLVLQNASVSLLTHHSRLPTAAGLYNTSSAVFMAEILKFLISLVMLLREQPRRKGGLLGNVTKVRGALGGAAQRGEVLKLAVPAALYATQNTLLYTALSNLDAATYQTTYQLKLLTAALFSIAFFNRRLAFTQWVALGILIIGVGIVQLDGTGLDLRRIFSSEGSGTVGGGDRRLGLLAILTACVSSGLAGGWFEYILKGRTSTIPSPSFPPSSKGSSTALPTPPTSTTIRHRPTSKEETPKSPTSSTSSLRPDSPSLWARNLQLGIPSLLFSFLGVLLSSSNASSSHFLLGGTAGMLKGFTPLVWSVVINQAAGGLLVAMVIRETDGVVKGFATSLGIILSTLVSALFLDKIPGLQFLLGATLVILSTILYAL